MIVQKITHGYVVQIFDTDKNQWVRQVFVAGDEVEWQVDGNLMLIKEASNTKAFNTYLPFTMEQPNAVH